MEKCIICEVEFKNKNLLSRHMNNHIEFVKDHINNICRLYALGYHSRLIIDELQSPFGKKWIDVNIIKNEDLFNEYLEQTKSEIVQLFRNENSVDDIKKIYKNLSKHTISKYLHEKIQKVEFDEIYKLRKNKKIGDSLRKEIELKKCLGCKVEFSKNTKYCSIECARKNGYQVSLETKKKMSDIKKNMYAEGNHAQGGGRTKWYQYKDIKVQGSFELRACRILDKMVELTVIKKWEYTNDRIKYVGFDSKKHTYLLDFKVYKNNGEFYYLETKGYKVELDDLKWEETKNQGYDLIVWFKQDLEQKEKEFNLRH